MFFNEVYIGLSNYIEMMQDPYFLNSITVTFLYTVGVLVIQNIVGLLLALIVDQKIPFCNFFRSVFFVPSLLSAVVVGYIFAYILSPHFGVMKEVFSFLPLHFLSDLDWLGDRRLALFSVVMVTAWQYMGYTMVIYLGALQSVPTELYESAAIDGAGRLIRFLKVTFPMIAQAVTINIILTTVGCLKMFDLIWVLTVGGPAMATQTIGIYIYRSAFHGNRAGYGNAVCIFLFILIVLISIIQVKYLTAREVEA
jgi:raffinose/stachyose/melibiose transport system permease protein